MTNLEYLKNKFPRAISSAKILARYMNSAHIELDSDFNEKELRKVICLLIDGYFQYRIDPDRLSDLFDKLFVISEDFDNLDHTETAYFLLDAVDLDIYLRHGFSRAPEVLSELVTFYKKWSSSVSPQQS